MSLQSLNRVVALGLLLISGLAATNAPQAWGQGEVHRKAKVKVPPVYPELAKRMHIAGVVKVEVTISPDGSVQGAKAVGGHPLFVAAALDSVKKWRFETSPGMSVQIEEFHFDPDQ